MLGPAPGWDSEPGLLRATEVPLDPATTVAVGVEHACAVHQDGSLTCWGRRTPGTPAATSPTRIEGVTDAEDVSAGAYRTCVRHADGTASCWGSNHFGQLGDGTFESRPSPTPVAGLEGVLSIEMGLHHTCALDDRGVVSCWGANASGELGVDTEGQPSPLPRPVEHLAEVAEIAVGTFHSCARLVDGTVACWGNSGGGALGVEEHPGRAAQVAGLTDVVALAAGVNLTCAAVRDGSVYCWGSIFAGEPSGVSRPRRVEGLDEVRALSAGTAHACALRRDASVWCWGWNIAGSLGNGRADNRWTDRVYRVRGL